MPPTPLTMRRALHLTAALAVAVAAALLLRAYVITLYVVPDASLGKPWQQGERAVGVKVCMPQPGRGDAVVYRFNGSDHMGRIVALPGDTVSIDARRYRIPPFLSCPLCGSGHCRRYLIDTAGARVLLHEEHIVARLYRMADLMSVQFWQQRR